MTKLKIDDLIFSELLPEMFKRVGLKSNDINNLTKIPNWVSSNSWTENDEEEFKTWLVQKLMYRLKLTRDDAIKQAHKFIMQYGWSTGKEKQLELF